MYQCYGVILLLWSACVTVYDQRVSDNLNVYTVVALGTAMLVYMKPVISIPGFLAAELLVLLGMPRFQPGGVAEHYGTYLSFSSSGGDCDCSQRLSLRYRPVGVSEAGTD